MRREFIFDLLRISLSNEIVEDVDRFADIDSDSWEEVCRFMIMHGVGAIAYHGIEKLPQIFRPVGSTLMNFIGVNILAKRSYAKLCDLLEKIEGVLKQEGIRSLLLKGFSLPEYYPKPELRKFIDIDLYAPDVASLIDKAFITKGINVDTGFIDIHI